MTDAQQREAARQFFTDGKIEGKRMSTPGLTGSSFFMMFSALKT